MAEKLIDKLKKIRENLQQPPKLSTVEQEKITATFDAMKEVLDDTLAIVLEKDRAEAFRYTNLVVTAIQQADMDFIAGVAVEEQKDPENEPEEIIPPGGQNPIQTKKESDRALERKTLRGPVDKPDFMLFTKDLTPKQMNIGMRLDCFKQFEEVGDDIVCADCSPERMAECIQMEDPTIDPNDDFELDVKMIRSNGDNP